MNRGRTAAARRGKESRQETCRFLELSCFPWDDSLVAMLCLRTLAFSIRRALSA